MADEVRGELIGVRTDAIEEARLAAAKNGNPSTYMPGAGRMPPSWRSRPLRSSSRWSSHGYPGRNPVAHMTVPTERRSNSSVGSPDRRRRRARRLAELAIETVFGGVVVAQVEQATLLEVGGRAHVGERTRELRPMSAPPDQSADEPYPVCGDGVQVEVAPLRRPDQLQRRQPPGAADVGHLVPALVELADRIHPPVDVHASVGPRQADVVTDGERHLAAARLSSSAICNPDADAPTTSTPPSAS